jgi:hypothetical protein
MAEALTKHKYGQIALYKKIEWWIEKGEKNAAVTSFKVLSQNLSEGTENF